MSITLTIPTVEPETRHGAARPVWVVAAKAGATATLTTVGYGVAVRAAGVPMKAGGLGAHLAKPVTASSFATGTIICAFWGAVLAVLIARYAQRPKRTFVAVAMCLTAISLVGPGAAGATPIQTKLALGFAHLLAAAIIVPALVRRLPDNSAAQPAPGARRPPKDIR
jgi:hypothetical protein